LVSGGRGITRANRVGVEKACLAGKNVMLANMTAALGGTRMSGVGRKGAKVGVRYDVRGYQNPVGIIKYVGPVHLVNSDRRAYDILPRNSQTTAKGNRRRGAKALAATGFGPYGKVHMKAKAGKNFTDRAETIVLAQSKRIIDKEIQAHLVRTFAGR